MPRPNRQSLSSVIDDHNYHVTREEIESLSDTRRSQGRCTPIPNRSFSRDKKEKTDSPINFHGIATRVFFSAPVTGGTRARGRREIERANLSRRPSSEGRGGAGASEFVINARVTRDLIQNPTPRPSPRPSVLRI